MKIINYTITLATIALLSCGSASVEVSDTSAVENISSDQTSAQIESIAKDLDATEFKNAMTKGKYQLIDVRTPEEHESGTIDGAVNINFLGADFKYEIQKLDPNTPVLVFCQAGGRSSKAMAELSEAGFSEVYNLLGGYGQWPK